MTNATIPFIRSRALLCAAIAVVAMLVAGWTANGAVLSVTNVTMLDDGVEVRVPDADATIRDGVIELVSLRTTTEIPTTISSSWTA